MAGPGPGAKAKAQKAQALKQKEETEKRKEEAEEEAYWDKGSNKRAKERAAMEAKKESERLAKAASKIEAEKADETSVSSMRAAAGKARKAEKAKKSKNDMSLINAFLQDQSKKGSGKAKKDKSQSNLLKPNLNRERLESTKSGNIEASGLENVFQALGIEDSQGEKGTGRKALYMAFEEKEMPRLIEENPNMRRAQLRDKVFRLWKKSPENPENQVSS